MFASFLFPFPLRNTPAPYLWPFYKQLSCLAADEVLFIGSPDYFCQQKHEDAKRDELHEAYATNYQYRVPTQRDIDARIKHELDPGMFDDLMADCVSPNFAWRELLTKPCPPLQQALEGILEAASREHNLEAVLTWCNCPSLTEAARKFSLPVIHNELGALRGPIYFPTMYFDRQGVNGRTDAEARYHRWRDESSDSEKSLLSREEILLLMSPEGMTPPEVQQANQFEIGLPLQIEDDSNVIAFAGGLTNYELITAARRLFAQNEVLVRQHPGSRLNYGDSLVVQDDSSNSRTFLERCKRIATINSSVGLEAMLFGKPTAILGDNPFRHFALRSLDELAKRTSVNTEDHLAALNHAVFGYLAPWEFLYDPEYYRWRLSDPSESEILSYHRDFYEAQHSEIITLPDVPASLGLRLASLHIGRMQKQLSEARAIASNLQACGERLPELQNELDARTHELHLEKQELHAHHELAVQLQKHVKEYELLLAATQEKLNAAESKIGEQDQEWHKQHEQLAKQFQVIDEQQALLNQRNKDVAYRDELLAHAERQQTETIEAVQELDRRVQSMQRSLSWKMTAPYRSIRNQLSRITHKLRGNTVDSTETSADTESKKAA